MQQLLYIFKIILKLCGLFTLSRAVQVALGLWLEKCILLLFLFRLSTIMAYRQCILYAQLLEGVHAYSSQFASADDMVRGFGYVFYKISTCFVTCLYSYLVIFFSFRICILVNSSD